MARVSRKEITKSNQEDLRVVSEKRIYKCGIYNRLSVTDGGHAERDTMENQIAINKKYLEQFNDIEIVNIYEENGVSGTSFDRPMFNQMINDIDLGLIDTVVVKDLSRLGRNALDATDYVTRIFPEKNVRFIIVSSQYDSISDDAEQSQLMIVLENLMNELYATRLSKKLVYVLEMKRNKGEYLANFAPYGYKKSEDDKHILEVDEPAAMVVRMIYEWRSRGLGYNVIYNRLNERGIPSPGEYRKMVGIHTNNNCKEHKILWSSHVLKDILKNQMYLGNLVQGKFRGALYKHQKMQAVPEEEWVIHEGAMEAIITKELFGKVQQINQKRADEYRNNYGANAHLPKASDMNFYTGKIFCADCGYSMKLIRSLNKEKTKAYFHYKCSRYVANGKIACTPKKISKTEIDKAVLSAINNQLKLFVDIRNNIITRNQSSEYKEKIRCLEKDIHKKKREIIRNEEYLSLLYEDYRNELLTVDEYKKAKDNAILYKKKLGEELRMNQLQLDKYSGRYGEHFKMTQITLSNICYKEMTKEIADVFVDKILVSNDAQVSLEIQLNFSDELKILLDENTGNEKVG